MNNELFIVGGISIGVVAIFLLFAYLKHKGINVKDILKTTKEDLNEVETCTEAAIGLTNGKLKKILENADAIEKLAITGCGYAEQMYISSQIDDPDGSKRKEEALDYIYTNLKNEGFKITDDVKTIASAIVENTVFSNKSIDAINKKIDDLIDKKVAALQKEKEEIQAKLNSTTNELTTAKTQIITLQNKFATAQSIFSPIQSTTDANNAAVQPVQNNTQK